MAIQTQDGQWRVATADEVVDIDDGYMITTFARLVWAAVIMGAG